MQAATAEISPETTTDSASIKNNEIHP